MTAIAKYSAVYIPNLLQNNKLKPDSNGYYNTTMGAFNIVSRNGVYYPATNAVLNLFKPGGIVRRRLDEGVMRSELGHPNIVGLDVKSILRRLAVIEEKNVCAHIRDLELIKGRDDKGQEIIIVNGSFKPSGPYGTTFKEQVDNPDENVAFSVRCFANQYINKGLLNKEAKDIITYDTVNDAGVKFASQFDYAKLATPTIGLESLCELSDISFTDTDLHNAIKQPNSSVGLESEFSRLTHVRTALGWQNIQVVDLGAVAWQ